MLPFCSPLWTGPSITGGEINSIHQLFVSLGPLMPPDIAQRGLINVCGLEPSPLVWHWIKTLLFTLSGTLVFFCQQPACQFCHNSDQDEFLWGGKCLPRGAITSSGVYKVRRALVIRGGCWVLRKTLSKFQRKKLSLQLSSKSSEGAEETDAMRPISFIVSRAIHTMSSLDSFIQQVWPVTSLLVANSAILFEKIYLTQTWQKY